MSLSVGTPVLAVRPSSFARPPEEAEILEIKEEVCKVKFKLLGSVWNVSKKDIKEIK